MNLGQQLLVCDGAMGTMLHAAGAALDRSLPELNLSDPALVSTIHESYLSAGADIIQTNTFGANRLWLGDHGLPDQVGEINRAGVRIARAAQDQCEREVWVAGSVSPAVTAGDTDPATRTGRPERSAAARASRTPARLISATLSGKPWSASHSLFAPNVLAWIMSAPAIR